MKFQFSFLLSVAICICAAAQNVSIKGKADSYKNKEVGVFVYDDLITMREVMLQSDTVDNNGNFQLNFSTDYTQRIFIKAGNQKAHLYVEPGKNYLVSLPPPDTSRYLNPHVEQLTNLILLVKDTTEINSLVMDYNNEFEKFWEDNYQLFIAKKSKPAIDSFQVKIGRKYKNIRNDFFHTYLEYSIAALKESTLQNHERLIFEYILHRPIAYNSYEYMSYFNSAFRDFLALYALSPQGSFVYTEINENASYEGLMKALSYHKFLKNDTLREFVMLKGLYELQSNSRFNPVKISNILEQVQSNSKIQAHRKIAFNILNSDSYLHLGAVAPNFTLKNKSGQNISLNDFSGKYIYLTFYQSSCTDCLRELKAINDLKKKYGDKIVFISVSGDPGIENFKDLLTKNPSFNWTFLYAGENHKILEDYKIKAFPEYYFINPQGKFDQCPAFRPGEIDYTFKSIKLKK